MDLSDPRWFHASVRADAASALFKSLPGGTRKIVPEWVVLQIVGAHREVHIKDTCGTPNGVQTRVRGFGALTLLGQPLPMR